MKQVHATTVIAHENPSSPVVSAYVPQLRSNNVDKVRIKLKKISRDARSLIGEKNKKELEDLIMVQLESRIEELAEKHQKGGFGIFLTENSAELVVFPWSGAEFVVVSSSFHTKPLVAWCQQPEKFLLLDVSSRPFRLSIGDRKSLLSMSTFEVPGDVGTNRKSGRKAKQKKPVAEFTLANRHLTKITPEIQAFLNEQEIPLVLVGPVRLTDKLKMSLHYPQIISEGIDCNTRSMTGAEIRKKVYSVLNRHFKEEKSLLVESVGSSQPIHSIHEIAKASVEGRVENLMVAKEHIVWGQLNRKTGDIVIHTKQENSLDDDLLDDISEEVLRFKGRVLVLPQKEIPGAQIACAELRW